MLRIRFSGWNASQAREETQNAKTTQKNTMPTVVLLASPLSSGTPAIDKLRCDKVKRLVKGVCRRALYCNLLDEFRPLASCDD